MGCPLRATSRRKPERTDRDERVLTAHDPVVSLNHGVDLLAIDRPRCLDGVCAPSPSAKRSGRWERWYEGCTTLENQDMMPLQRASSAGSLDISFFLKTVLQGM